MRVVLSPNFETPLVTITFFVNHGTLDDPIGSEGYGNQFKSNLFSSYPKGESFNNKRYREDFIASLKRGLGG